MKSQPPLTFATVTSGLLLIAVGVLLAVRPYAESTVWIVEVSRGAITVPVMTAIFAGCGGAILYFRPSVRPFARLHTPLVYLLGLNIGFLVTIDSRPLWVVVIYVALLIALLRMRWMELQRVTPSFTKHTA